MAEVPGGMPEDLATAVGGEGLTVHTDGGACMGERRGRPAGARGATRSMPRKGGSPDDARAEGFFGTLKCDFFEGWDWTGATFEEFSRRPDAHIERQWGAKVKKALGRKTPRQRREELGYAAQPERPEKRLGFRPPALPVFGAFLLPPALAVGGKPPVPATRAGGPHGRGDDCTADDGTPRPRSRSTRASR